jgi:hypothetical protein
MCDTSEIIMVSARAAILLLCTVGGLLCIYLGWRLYKDVILVSARGEMEAPGFKFKLASGGPGIFLVAFGIWLLLSMSNRTLILEDSGNVKPTAMQSNSPHLSGFIRVQSIEQKQCLLYTRKRVFALDEELTNKQIETLAQEAAVAVRMAGSSGIADEEKRARVIGQLHVLEKIANESLP